MKALSLRQPWAWLILHGGKNIENRLWNTKFRGEFLIHASATVRQADYDLAQTFMKHAGIDIEMPPLKELPTGGIVGKATLVDVIPPFYNQDVGDDLWHMEGLHGFVLQDVEPVTFYKVKGALKFFEVDVVEYMDVAKLSEEYDPFMDDPWSCGDVSRDLIQLAIDTEDWIDTPFSGIQSEEDDDPAEWTAFDHARRVAYLVEHPAADPIAMDFGVPVLGYPVGWPIYDGNHRYMAAVFRRDKTIAVCASGQCDEFSRFLVPDPIKTA